jgi:hypothetical protein
MSFLITYHVLLFITGKDNLFPIPEDLDLRLVKFRIECGFGSLKKYLGSDRIRIRNSVYR